MLGLLAEMEASLRGSHAAVLKSNGLLLENCTREQVRLHRALEMILVPEPWPGTGRVNEVGAVSKAAKSSSWKVRERAPRCAAAMSAELLAAGKRVLDATRVQRALLRRARQFQLILANLAVAPGATSRS